MKNLLFALLATAAIGFTSCGDDECTNADWAGTWILDGESICEADTNISALDTLTISASDTEGIIVVDGIESTVTDCQVSALAGAITMELDGDKITSSIGDCNFEYRK